VLGRTGSPASGDATHVSSLKCSGCRKTMGRSFDAGKAEEGVDEFEQAHAVAVREMHERAIIGQRVSLGFSKHFLQRT
jgi:hypothetical protein